MEVERKFLVAELPDFETADSILLRQGYLATRPVEVRVRSHGEDRFVLTIKGPGSLERQGVEILLERPQFFELWPLTEGRRLEKVRYRLPVGSHVLELDIYRDRHQGLITAEVA